MLTYQEILDWFKQRGYHVEAHKTPHQVYLYHATAWQPDYPKHRVMFELYKEQRVFHATTEAAVVGECYFTTPEGTSLACKIHHMDSSTIEALAASVDLANYRFQLIKNNIPRLPTS